MMRNEKVKKQILSGIEQLQSALFFPETMAGLLPAFILQQVKANEAGELLFDVSCSPKTRYIADDSFPCRLDFFKKGATFHLKINGIATVTHKRAEEHSARLTVKVKIEKGTFFEIPALEEVIVSNYKDNIFMDKVSNVINKLSLRFSIS